MSDVTVDSPIQPIPRRIQFTRSLMRALGNVLFTHMAARLTVNGREHIPATGATILLINHLTLFDPVAAILGLRGRDLNGLVKYELYEQLWSRWIIVGWGAVPIRRFVLDRAALKAALAVFKTPDMLLVAPEGHRHPAMTDPKEGVAFLAHKANAMLMPTGISGTENLLHNMKRLRRTPITVNYGRPVRLRAGDRAGRLHARYSRTDVSNCAAGHRKPARRLC